jgi:zinc protease
VVSRHLITVALGLTIAIAATGGALAQDAQRGGIFPYPTHVETLGNGLRVILIPMSSNGLVAYWSVVRTGSRDEYEPGRSGFAHFFEHMMFRGTEKFPAQKYNEILTRMGADTNAFTTDDLTAYHMGIASEDLETAMELESDRFRNLAYGKSEFETEAGAVYGEYRKNRSSPFFQLSEAMQEKAFQKHTYGHTTMGYERDIKQMPRMYDYSLSFFSRYYRPENVILLIVGDLEIAPTMALVHEYYDGWEKGYVAPKIPVEPEQKSERHVEVTYEGRSLPILMMSYKADAFDPTSRRHVAADLLSELAFGNTSDLHKKLVLDEQLVEFIGADMGMNRDPGTFDVFARIKDPARIEDVATEIDATIRHYQEALPDPKRLGDLKSRLKYNFLMNLDTPDRVASALSRIVAITGGAEAIDRLYATYDQITPEDVRDAANHYLAPERRTVGLLKEGAR